MAIQVPEFDFANYNPRDEWRFPPQRLVQFAAEAYLLLSETRTQAAKRHIYPDLRFVIWHEFSGYAHAMLVVAMHLRSHGDSEDWWESQPEFGHRFTRNLIAHNNISVRRMAQLGFVQNIVRTTDSAIRQMAAAVLETDNDTRRPLSSVWHDVLVACDHGSQKALLQLWLVYRDSLSQNGRFCPVDGKDLHFRFDGRNYHFEANKEIDPVSMGFADQWDFLLYLLQQLTALLSALFASDPISSINDLRLPYLDA